MKGFIVYLWLLTTIFLLDYHVDSSNVDGNEGSFHQEAEKDTLADPTQPKSYEDIKIKKGTKEPASKTDDEVISREEDAIKLDGLNVSQLKEMREKAEKFRFQAEVDKMMKLIINSLYTNKEIFLRELISNASDALDKIRFLSLTNTSVLGSSQDLFIKIKADKINNLLRITDTGIGMTREELIKQLGTIANSGTTEFLTKVEKEDSGNLGDFIGQFGVGFYSVYLVADSVTVISKSNEDDQYIWESDSSNQFSVTKDPRGNTLSRGTEVVIRLKSSAKEYLEVENLKRLIRQYSQYLSFPIYLWSSKTLEEGKDTTDPKEVMKDEKETSDSKEKKGPNKSPKIKWDWYRINENKPIWTRKTSQITEEEYISFYKTLTKSNEEPLAKIHFSAEGEVTFKALLYIPPKAPQNLYERDVKESSIRLHVRRVFITDKIHDIIPRYLSFIIGIVDSDDLPLNVSRETLQQEKLMKVIQKKLVRKALDMIKKMKKEKFDIFWKEFKASINMGIVEDDTNRNRLTKLMHTQSSKSHPNITSFSEYVSRMKPQQEEIFYVAAESLEHAKSLPFVEKYLKHDYEVLFFTDVLDEHALHLTEKFEGKPLLNIARGGISFDKTEGAKSKMDARKSDFNVLFNFLKNDVEIINNYIANVVLTDRLYSDPFAIVPQEQGWTGNMERLGRSQSGKRDDDLIIMEHIGVKKNLEVNFKHPIVMKLNDMIKSHEEYKTEKSFINYAIVLFETAMVKCGYLMNNSIVYSSTVEQLVTYNLKNNNKQLWEEVENVRTDEEVQVEDESDTYKYKGKFNHAVPQDASDYVDKYASEEPEQPYSEKIEDPEVPETVLEEQTNAKINVDEHNEL